MNGVQTRFKCKLDVKRCKRFVFPPSSLLPRSNALKTKAIRYFQTDRTLTRIVSPPLRQDFAGAWISREAYGDTDNILGWEIDHVYPEELGGGNHIENLRPMNWRNNRSKGTDYPHYTAVVTSEENKNIYRDTACTVSDALQTTLQKLYNI